MSQTDITNHHKVSALSSLEKGYQQTCLAILHIIGISIKMNPQRLKRKGINKHACQILSNKWNETIVGTIK
jgi:hypothetical protein